MEKPSDQLLFPLRAGLRTAAHPAAEGGKGGAAPLPLSEYHQPLKGAGTQQKGHHGPAHRLPVRAAVHGGGVPEGPLLLGQGVCHPGRQHPVQLLLAFDCAALQPARRCPDPGEQFLEGHAPEMPRV